MSLVEENISVEVLFGVVSDFVSLTLPKAPKRLTFSKLEEMVARGLNRRSCRTAIIPSGMAITGPTSQLAEKISVADDMESVCDLMKAQGNVPAEPEKADRHQDSSESSQTRAKNVPGRMLRKLALRKIPYISEIAKYVADLLHKPSAAVSQS